MHNILRLSLTTPYPKSAKTKEIGSQVIGYGRQYEIDTFFSKYYIKVFKEKIELSILRKTTSYMYEETIWEMRIPFNSYIETRLYIEKDYLDQVENMPELKHH